MENRFWLNYLTRSHFHWGGNFNSAEQGKGTKKVEIDNYVYTPQIAKYTTFCFKIHFIILLLV